MTRIKLLTLIAAMAGLVAALATKTATAAPVQDPDPQARFGVLNVPCYDAGTNLAVLVPFTPVNSNSVIIQNLGVSHIYCGQDAGVTENTGIRVGSAGGAFTFDLKTTSSGPPLYCMGGTCAGATVPSQAAGTANTRWMRIK